MKNKFLKKLVALILCMAIVLGCGTYSMADTTTDTGTDSQTGQETDADGFSSESDGDTGTDTEGTEQAEQTVLTFEEDGITVTVSDQTAGAIPEGTSLAVTDVIYTESTDGLTEEEIAEAEQINALYTKVAEVIAEDVDDVKGFVAYDISLLDTAGASVQPGSAVDVELTFSSGIIPAGLDAETDHDIALVHLTETDGTITAAEAVDATITEGEGQKVTKAAFEASGFSVYALVWTAEDPVSTTLTGNVTALNGSDITGASDLAIAVPDDESALTFEEYDTLSVDVNTGTEEEPVITTTVYDLDAVQLIDGSDAVIEIAGLKLDKTANTLCYTTLIEAADSGTETVWTAFDVTAYELRFVYEKAQMSLTANHVGKNTSGYIYSSVVMNLRNDEVVTLKEGSADLFAEDTESNITYKDAEIQETVEVSGVTYKYRRAVILAKNSAFNGTNGTVVTNVKLEDEKIKYSTNSGTSYSNFDSSKNRLVFVYYNADITSMNLTAKVANYDKTGALQSAGVTFTITKEAGAVATADDAVTTFDDYTAEYLEDGTTPNPKNLLTIDGKEYKFEGAYITSKAMYGLDADNGTKIQALRIYYDKIQYQQSGKTTWADLGSNKLYLVYKEQGVLSRTVTMTAVLADGTNNNLGTVSVDLAYTLNEAGAVASYTTDVTTIASLVEDGTIPESYVVDGETYKFRDAMIVSTPTAYKRETYATSSNSTIITGLLMQNTIVQFKGKDNKISALAQRSVVLIYAKDLTTVETVDSTALGVTMRVVNFKKQQYNFGGPYALNKGRTAGLLTSTVGENGYPSTIAGGIDFESWFGENPTDSNVGSSTAANHLFLLDEYEESGTFRYCSFDNYAYFNQSTGNFTVYEEIGVPNQDDKYYQKRGNFIPFNTITPGKFSKFVNQYDSSGNELSEEDPRYGEDLYLSQGTVDYYHGLYLEAEFAQPNDGIYRGEPMRFEFNGDDDFWVYLDGVLVLDIGGIHDAQDGYIDFSTGQVYVQKLSNGTGTDTTIKAMFEAAGVDTTYGFEGETFADGSLHTFQVFYMERGAGASNLEINFNLPTIPAGTIQVEKQLANTEQEAYTDIDFAFRVYAQKVIGQESREDENGQIVLIETYSEDEYVVLGEGSGATIVGTDEELEFDEDGTFYIKPTEVANFPNIQANRKYYVEEVDLAALERANLIDVELTRYTENGTSVIREGENILNEDGEVDIVRTTSMETSNRKKVTFLNTVTDANLGNVQIEKEIVNGNQDPDYGFDFKVTVESNITGEMVPYVGAYYMIDKATGKYIDNEGNLQELAEGEEPEVYGRTNNGIIRGVMVDQIVELQGFYKDTQFIVEEVNLDKIYETPVITYVPDTCKIKTTDDVTTYHVEEGKTAEVVVTNKEKMSYDWTFYKKDLNSDQLLEGAKFELTSADGSKTYYGKSVKDDVDTEDVDETGMVVWYTDKLMLEQTDDILAGTYFLTETKAPKGYSLSGEVWTVVFADEASPVVYKGKHTGEIPEDAELVENHLAESLDDAGVRHVITKFYYENEMLYELPSTGGPGIYGFMMAGVALLMAAATLFFRNRSRVAVRRRY